MRAKLSFHDLVVVCYGSYIPWSEYKSRLLSRATRKRHIHKHKPTYKPPKGMIPSAYRRLKLGATYGKSYS